MFQLVSENLKKESVNKKCTCPYPPGHQMVNA